MGSSVGVHKIGDKVEFEEALKDAFRFDTKVVVEEMIVGRELECAVLGLYDTIEVTHPGEVVTDQVYSFDEKYSESSSAQTDIPVRGISEEAITELRNTAIRAFKALNCEIISRVDMFLTEDDEIYVNEIIVRFLDLRVSVCIQNSGSMKVFLTLICSPNLLG